MKTIELMKMCEQAQDEAKAWHKANIPGLTDARLADFSAGFADGWRKAISTLKLHKAVTIRD